MDDFHLKARHSRFASMSSCTEVCPAGLVCEGLSQLPCPPGFFCPLDTSPHAFPCPDMTYPSSSIPLGLRVLCEGGYASAAPCPAGYVCPNTTTKIFCPAGHYCAEGTLIPHPCPPSWLLGTAAASRCPAGSRQDSAQPELLILLAFIFVPLVVALECFSCFERRQRKRHHWQRKDRRSLLSSSSLERLIQSTSKHLSKRASMLQRASRQPGSDGDVAMAAAVHVHHISSQEISYSTHADFLSPQSASAGVLEEELEREFESMHPEAARLKKTMPADMGDSYYWYLANMTRQQQPLTGRRPPPTRAFARKPSCDARGGTVAVAAASEGEMSCSGGRRRRVQSEGSVLERARVRVEGEGSVLVRTGRVRKARTVKSLGVKRLGVTKGGGDDDPQERSLEIDDPHNTG